HGPRLPGAAARPLGGGPPRPRPVRCRAPPRHPHPCPRGDRRPAHPAFPRPPTRRGPPRLREAHPAARPRPHDPARSPRAGQRGTAGAAAQPRRPGCRHRQRSPAPRGGSVTKHRFPDGTVAVVTGAARGVGALLARRLAACGARVALFGLEPEELATTAAACGPESSFWEVDVTARAALAAAAREIEDRYGRIDIVVANAGIAVGGPFLDSDPVFFDRVIEVNLLGSVTTARAFLPALLRHRGYLLQIASLAALTPAPMMSAHCASKSGVEAFAQAVRVEVAHRGVDVGVAYLSWTDTDMVRGADA